MLESCIKEWFQNEVVKPNVFHATMRHFGKNEKMFKRFQILNYIGNFKDSIIYSNLGFSEREENAVLY